MRKGRDGEMREELRGLFEEELYGIDEGVDVGVCAHVDCLCIILCFLCSWRLVASLSLSVCT